jgi:hypothetical protein
MTDHEGEDCTLCEDAVPVELCENCSRLVCDDCSEDVAGSRVCHACDSPDWLADEEEQRRMREDVLRDVDDLEDEQWSEMLDERI